jgi:hypothetical protein
VVLQEQVVELMAHLVELMVVAVVLQLPVLAVAVAVFVMPTMFL